MAYSLGSATAPNTTWGAHYNALGDIQIENCVKGAFLTDMPLFGSDSDETDVFDFGGTVRKIILTAFKTGTPTELATFTIALNTLINGDQSPDQKYPIDYVSDLLGTIKVKIDNISLTWAAGQPTILRYTIQMIESSSVG